MTTATNTETPVEVESRESKKEYITALLKGGATTNNPVTSNLLVYSGLANFPLLYREDGQPTLAFLGGIGGRPVNGSPNLGVWMRKYGEDQGIPGPFITADRELVPVFALIDRDIAVEVNVSPLALVLGMDAFKGAQEQGNTERLIEMCREIKAKYTGSSELTDKRPLDKPIAWGHDLDNRYRDTCALLIYKSEGEVKVDFVRGGGVQVAPETSKGYYDFFLVASEESGNDQYRQVVIDADTLVPVFALIERGTIKDTPLIALALGQYALDSLQSPDTIEYLAELWLGVHGYGLQDDKAE